MTLFKFKDAGVNYAYTSEELRTNSRTVFNSAIKNTDAMRDGIDWYAWEAADLKELSIRYGIPFVALAGAASVLSSTMPWERNIPAMQIVVEAYLDGKRGKELPGVARSFEPIRKIERMLNDPSYLNVFRNIVAIPKNVPGRSFKTLNFFHNLMGAANFVTVDVWMWRMFSADMSTQYRPGGHLYIECANIIREYAAEIGVEPMQMQAIMWMHFANKPAAMRA